MYCEQLLINSYLLLSEESICVAQLCGEGERERIIFTYSRVHLRTSFMLYRKISDQNFGKRLQIHNYSKRLKVFLFQEALISTACVRTPSSPSTP